MGDPLDVKLEVEVPEEVLAKGWLPVLQYLRELRDQVGPVLTCTQQIFFYLDFSRQDSVIET